MPETVTGPREVTLGDDGRIVIVARYDTDHDLDIYPGIVAGAAPLAPPAAWFDDPRLPELTPLTVTDDGRVYGHLAGWDTCHTGFDECVLAPRGGDYTTFRTGLVATAEGSEVPTGRITMDTLHARTRLTAGQTAAHYEHTGAAVADVAAGEDAHGIWVAGAVRPGVSDEQVRTLRASPLSGDWRTVGGRLQLVAALAVNSPGFPVPRAMVASGGRVASLQSAGVVRPVSSERERLLSRVVERERAAERDVRVRADRARARLLVASARRMFG